MWFAVIDDKVFLRTQATSPKVKRIRHQPIVKVAVCTIRGKPLDGYIECIARIIPREGEAEAEAALDRGYGLARREFTWGFRSEYTYLQLTPVSASRPTSGDETPPMGANAIHPARREPPPGAA
jgi:PPOX class probable F420-dependent enzyme